MQIIFILAANIFFQNLTSTPERIRFEHLELMFQSNAGGMVLLVATLSMRLIFFENGFVNKCKLNNKDSYLCSL